MVKKKWFLILLITLIIMMAGCAVTQGDSTPAAPNDKQEHTGSSEGETADTEIVSPAKENNSQSIENQTADNNSADEPEAAEHDSDELLPMADNNQVNKVKLLVTRNFGSQAILQEMVGIEKNWTVMDILKNKMTVETRYGGGFIDSINGIKGSSGGLSGEMQDWFYYVNGICPNVGGADYLISSGEVIWWDYHAWKAGPANAAVVGCYPEPFLHGYEGEIKSTTIMCPSDDLEAGYRLEQALKAKGVGSVKVMQIDEGLLANRPGPTIVVGEWEELNRSPFLQDFNQAYKRNGAGVHFNESKLELIDIQGQVKRSIDESAGVIAAAGSGLGDSCPLWLVSGTDLSGFQWALDILLNTPEKIAGKYNVAITAGEMISLPLY